jgi:hypothetical protein
VRVILSEAHPSRIAAFRYILTRNWMDTVEHFFKTLHRIFLAYRFLAVPAVHSVLAVAKGGSTPNTSMPLSAFTKNAGPTND